MYVDFHLFCLFSEREDVLDVTSINADNNTYNLDQMMSINMEDSDIIQENIIVVKDRSDSDGR